MSLRKRLLTLGLAVTVVFSVIPVHNKVIAKTKYESVKSFISLIKKETKLSVETDEETLTNEVAADLLVQAFHQLNKTVKEYYRPDGFSDMSFPNFKKLVPFKEIVEKYGYTAVTVKYWGRISDLSKVSKEYKDSVVLAFTYGLMEGKSNGAYTTSRTFNPASKVTTDKAKLYVTRLTDKKKRAVISDDGQVCRTTNLPKNKADLNFVLEAFPNAYYEMVPEYRAIGKTAKGAKDAIQTQKYMEYENGCDPQFQLLYEDNIKDYLETILNVNYKTIGSKWKNKVLSFYKRDVYEFSYDELKKGASKYVSDVKSNKVIVEAKKITVDWNSMYTITTYNIGFKPLSCISDSLGFSNKFVRCYVEYTVKSAKNLKGTILFDSINNKAYKKGKIYKAYVDVPVGLYGYGETIVEPVGCVFVNTSSVPKLTKSVYKYTYKKTNQLYYPEQSYLAYPMIIKDFEKMIDVWYNAKE